MLGIVGYSDRIYCRPGEIVNFKISCESVDAYDAEIVRLVCGDDNPEGPRVKELQVKTAIDGHYKGHRQKIYAGSYAEVPDAAALRGNSKLHYPGLRLADHTHERNAGDHCQMVAKDRRLRTDRGRSRYCRLDDWRWYPCGNSIGWEAHAGAPLV